ncbi:MAG: hypothetical protein GXN93_01225 [Candidatus Diapherotrites archaeon]|nr:hypothetical protein [Candidatus Diapherotrites archaeon]
MRQWWLILLLATSLVIITYEHTIPSTNHCATVYALGYNGEQGVPIPITACVAQGNGRVYVSSDGIMTEDFQTAIRTAFSVLRSRYSIGNKNIYITVGGPSTILQGESAGAAIYAAMFAAISGLHPHDLAASGVISPNGFVEQILYAREKAQAYNGTVILPEGSCIRGARCVRTVADIERIVASQSV